MPSVFFFTMGVHIKSSSIANLLAKLTDSDCDVDGNDASSGSSSSGVIEYCHHQLSLLLATHPYHNCKPTWFLHFWFFTICRICFGNHLGDFRCLVIILRFVTNFWLNFSLSPFIDRCIEIQKFSLFLAHC